MSKDITILDDLISWVRQHKITLIILCCVGVFKGKIKEWISAYICPITSCVHDDNVVALICILVGVVIVYLLQYNWLKKERENVVSRNWTLFILFIVYLIFRTDGDFYFNGIKGCVFGYIDYAWMLITIIEFLLFRKRLLKNCDAQAIKTGSLPFLADTPTDDDHMGRGRYTEQLVDKILATQNAQQSNECGAFTILVNEHYGVGKTSLFMQLHRIAEEKEIDVCWFKPWLYEDNKSLIVNFFRLIKEKLGEGDKPLLKMLNRYAEILSSIEGYRLFPALHIEESSIETQFEDIQNRLRRKCRPIIVLIDDVDRLQGEELLKMLQMIRNMADFPNLYYIIAGDKAAMTSRLKEETISEPEEYLKKFFNMEVRFPAVDTELDDIFQERLKNIMEYYGIDSENVWQYIAQFKFKKEVFASLRDVNRYLNMLDFALANCQKSGVLPDIHILDLVGICMIQYVDSELYEILRDHDNYIIQFKDWRLQVKKDYAQYFVDRATKEEQEQFIESMVLQNKEKTKAEAVTQIQSIEDLKRLSKPFKIEIIGRLLESLFPASLSFHPQDKTRIFHPTEYFKYFSFAYKKNEMSKAEVAGIMEKEGTEFTKAVKQIFTDGRIKAFRHKMLWYLQTQQYNRPQCLERVFEVYNREIATNSEVNGPSVKSLFYHQYYAGLVMAVFERQTGESEKQIKKEWSTMREWLIHSTKYDERIAVLQTLISFIDHTPFYIYESEQELRNCIEKSGLQYIQKVWTQKKYIPSIYKRIGEYRGMDYMHDRMSEFIYKELQKMKNIQILLYHFIEPMPDGIRWNTDFIEGVFDNMYAFNIDTSYWLNLVPKKWRGEFVAFKMKHNITQEEIENSTFLQHAIAFWKKERRNNNTTNNISLNPHVG